MPEEALFFVTEDHASHGPDGSSCVRAIACADPDSREINNTRPPGFRDVRVGVLASFDVDVCALRAFAKAEGHPCETNKRVVVEVDIFMVIIEDRTPGCGLICRKAEAIDAEIETFPFVVDMYLEVDCHPAEGGGLLRAIVDDVQSVTRRALHSGVHADAEWVDSGEDDMSFGRDSIEKFGEDLKCLILLLVLKGNSDIMYRPSAVLIYRETVYLPREDAFDISHTAGFCCSGELPDFPVVG